MKSQNANQRKAGAGRSDTPIRVPRLPMEWMDPMSWRLPSGQALAEFALEAGFLAPLMLGVPNFKRRKKAVEPLAGKGAPLVETSVKAGLGVKSGIGLKSGLGLEGSGLGLRDKQAQEVPEQSGSFRNKR
jgi:hypothetical protein